MRRQIDKVLKEIEEIQFAEKQAQANQSLQVNRPSEHLDMHGRKVTFVSPMLAKLRTGVRP